MVKMVISSFRIRLIRNCDIGTMIFRLVVVMGLLGGLVGQAWAEEESVADSVRKYRFLAKTARDKKEYADAIRYYQAYLRYEPADLKALFFLGEVSFRIQDYTGAKEALKRAIALDSLHVNTNLILYNIYMKEYEWADSLAVRPEVVADSAARCLERVLQVNGADADKRRNLADLYWRARRIDRAIPHYEQLVAQLSAASDTATTGVGTQTVAAQPAGSQGEANAEAIARQARLKELSELIAVLYEDLGQADRALEWRQRLLGGAANAQDRMAQRDGLEAMLRLQLETGDVTSAMNTLLQLAEIDSANSYSYYSRLASLAGQEGDRQLRRRSWEGMVRANPRDLETVALLAESYLNDGNTGQADQWLARGLRVNGRDAHLQLLKGDLLTRQGDEEGAIAAFELAKTDPRWESVAQQRIWELRPPETPEEKLKREFFGKGKTTE